MIKKKQLWFTVLFLLFTGILLAQETTKTFWVFRFVPKKDMFYVPYKENEAELRGLLDTLAAHRKYLCSGELYINVSCYTVSGNAEMSAKRMAYLRSSRVKSELIMKGGVTEDMFVTDKQLPYAYGTDSLLNVVVVSFPASIEKVEQLAGTDAATKVRIYYQAIEEKIKLAEEEQRAIEENERIAAEREAEIQHQAAEAVRIKEEIEKETVDEEIPAPVVRSADYRFALRANLLHWATLTPDIGIEWRINRNIGILVNGSWTSWTWKDKERRYALWKVSPEIRYYMGKEKSGYLGAMYHIGDFNYKPGETGKQGNYCGGGVTGGYMLNLPRSLSLDFHAGFGYTYVGYDKYKIAEGVRVKTGSGTKNYWGINQIGVTLVWRIN